MKMQKEELEKYTDIIVLFIKKRECVAVPNSVFSEVLKTLETRKISFTFKKDAKSKWTIIHALYCNCN